MGGKRRSRPGHAPFPFNGVHEGGFLTADKGTGPLVDGQLKAEIGPKDVLSEKAVFFCRGNGHIQPLDGQGIFGPTVDITLV